MWDGCCGSSSCFSTGTNTRYWSARFLSLWDLGTLVDGEQRGQVGLAPTRPEEKTAGGFGGFQESGSRSALSERQNLWQ